MHLIKHIKHASLLFIFIFIDVFTFGQTIDFYKELKTNHSYPIEHIFTSFSGKYFATSQGQKIDIYNAETFELIKTFNFNKGQEISEVLFTPNDSFLWISHQNTSDYTIFNQKDKIIYSYNWFTENQTTKPYFNSCIAFSNIDSSRYLVIADNKYFKYKNDWGDSTRASLSTDILCYHKTTKTNKTRSIKFDEVVDITISQNDSLLAIAFLKGYILMLDPNTLQTLDSIPAITNINPPKEIKITDDNRFLIYHYKGLNKVYIYDILKRQLHYEFENLETIDRIIAIDANQNYLAIVYSHFLKIIEYKTKKEIFEENLFRLHNSAINQVNCMKFLSNTDKLMLGGYSYSNTNINDYIPRIIVFDFKKYNKLISETDANQGFVAKKLRDKTYISTQTWHKDGVDQILSSDKTFATVSDQSILIWSKKSLLKLNSYHFSQPIENVNYSNDGKYFVMAHQGNEDLKIINTQTNEQLILTKTSKINFKFSSLSYLALYKSDYLFTFDNYDKCYIYSFKDSSFTSIYNLSFDISKLLCEPIRFKNQICVLIISDENQLLLFDPFKNEIVQSVNLSKDVIYLNQSKGKTIVTFSDGTLTFYNPEKNSFEFQFKFKSIDQILNFNLIDEKAAFVSYKNEESGYVQSLISLGTKNEKILHTDQFIYESGLIDSLTYFIIGMDGMEFYNLNSNKLFKEVKRLQSNFGEARLNHISKRNNLLSIDYNIVDLKNAEIRKNSTLSNLFFFKDDLYISEIIINPFSDEEEIGIGIYNEKGDTIKKVTIKNSPTDIYITDIKVSNSNNKAVSFDFNNKLIVWDLEKSKVLNQIKSSQFNNFSWHPTEDKFTYSEAKNYYNDYELKVYDAEKDKFIEAVSPKLTVMDKVCFSPIENNVFVGSSRIYEYNFKTGTYSEDYFYHPTYISSIYFDQQNNYLIVGLESGEIFIWDYTAKKIKYRLWKHTGEIIELFVDDNILISSSEDQSVNIWDLRTGELMATYYQFKNENRYEYCFITDDNYYKASKGISDFIYFVDQDEAYPFEQFDLNFNRPDIILSKLKYADSSLIKAYYKAYQKRLKSVGFKESDFNNELHIPKSKIVEVGNKEKIVADKHFKIEVNFQDDLYYLKEYQIWINNIPLFGSKGFDISKSKSKELNKTLELTLNEGLNKIQVSCINEKGAESLKESYEVTYTPAQQTNPDLYLIAISSSNYQNEKFNLKYAVKDGRDLIKTFSDFETDYNNIIIDTLFNQNAKRENILELKSKLLNTDVDDQVVLFISGHGMLDQNYDFWFATYNMDFNDPSKYGIRYEELEWLLDSIPARKKLLLMDACHSGEVDKDAAKSQEITGNNSNDLAVNTKVQFRSVENENTPKLGLQNSFDLMQEMFVNLNKGSGAQVISAAAGNSYALESDEWNNGVFTYSILNGLLGFKADGNNDEQITVSELKKYVGKQVEELTNGAQKPTSRQENLEFDFRVR